MKKNTNGKTLEILFADADKGLNLAFGSFMKDKGVPVQLFSSSEALLQALNNHPALVIINTNLAGTNGTSIIDEIRRRAGESVPVVVIMEDDSQALEAEIVRKNVLCRLMSPPDFLEIFEIVKKLGCKSHE